MDFLDVSTFDEPTFNKLELESTFDRVKWVDWWIDLKKLNKYYLEVIVDNLLILINEKKDGTLSDEEIKLLDLWIDKLNDLINRYKGENDKIYKRTWVELSNLKNFIFYKNNKDSLSNIKKVSLEDSVYVKKWNTTFVYPNDSDSVTVDIIRPNWKKWKMTISKSEWEDSYENPFFDEMFEND